MGLSSPNLKQLKNLNINKQKPEGHVMTQQLFDSKGQVLPLSDVALQRAFKAMEIETKGATSGEIYGSSLFRAGQPIYRDYTVKQALADGWKRAPLIYAAASLFSESFASIPWVVEHRESSGTWCKAEGHPLQALIDKPNPTMSIHQIKEQIALHSFLGGNAMLTKNRSVLSTRNGEVNELWLAYPDLLRPVPSEDNWVEHYGFKPRGKPRQFLHASDVIHFMQQDPSNPFWGVGIVQVLLRIIETDSEAVDFQKVSFANRGAPSGLLTYKDALSDPQYKQAREYINQHISGTANAQKVLLLDRDADYQKMAHTPAELDFIKSREHMQGEIFRVLRVPPILFGDFGNATMNNAKIARTFFWVDRLIPWAKGFEETLNFSLIPDFGERSDLRIRFDFSRVDALFDLFATRLKAAVDLKKISPNIPITVINRRLELGLSEEDLIEIAAADEAATALELANQEEGPTAEITQLEPTPVPELEPAHEEHEPAGEENSIIDADFKVNKAEQQRLKIKALDDEREAWQEKLAPAVAEMFKIMKKDVLQTLENNDRVAASAMILSYESIWAEFLTAFYIEGYSYFADDVTTAFGASDLDIDSLKAELKLLAITSAEYIIKTTLDQYDASLVVVDRANLEDNVDVKAIEILFDSWIEPSEEKQSRSVFIARMETGFVVNAGRDAGAIHVANELKIKLIKTWVTKEDLLVRDLHYVLEGEQIQLGSYYSNGMRYPHDPVAPIEQRANCRCYELLAIKA